MLPLERLEEHLCHIEAALLRGVLETGRARPVDLGQAIADHVEADPQQQAVARAPFMVAGTGRFDTRVMQWLGERVFCKVGAEGVYWAALPGLGLGVAIKMDDGNNARACAVVMACVILSLVQLKDTERDFMQRLAAPTLKNWNGTLVGALRPAADLRIAPPA